MWDKVVEVCVALLRNDAQLSTLLGGPHIYRNRSTPRIQSPGVFYTVVSDSIEENYAPTTLQWDIFAEDLDNVAKIQKRLFDLMHSDLPVTIGGLTMWSQYEGGYDYAAEEETIAHRAVEYKYTPARENG